MSLKPILVITAAQSIALLGQSTAPVSAELHVERDIAYVEPKNPRQMLDIYMPAAAKGAPVVVWIHGGGWQTGDKTEVASKPLAFTRKGFVFVAVSYRFVTNVAMKGDRRGHCEIRRLGARSHRDARGRSQPDLSDGRSRQAHNWLPWCALMTGS